MTTSQLLAIAMPLFTTAIVGVTALFVRRPWVEEAIEARPKTAALPPSVPNQTTTFS
jgi:hypothetical protein